MYIYKITNVINDKIYIGQTIQSNAKMRWYSHVADARGGKPGHLYNAIRKYGVDNFVWQIIDTANSIEDLNLKEQHWLEKLRETNEVYNLRTAGNNKLHSEESKLRMSESQKAAHARRRQLGTEGGWKRIDGGPMLGKSHPKKGKPSKKWSEEAKAKLSLVAKEREARKKLARMEK
jgi:group I intron endonuclease